VRLCRGSVRSFSLKISALSAAGTPGSPALLHDCGLAHQARAGVGLREITRHHFRNLTRVAVAPEGCKMPATFEFERQEIPSYSLV